MRSATFRRRHFPFRRVPWVVNVYEALKETNVRVAARYFASRHRSFGGARHAEQVERRVAAQIAHHAGTRRSTEKCNDVTRGGARDSLAQVVEWKSTHGVHLHNRKWRLLGWVKLKCMRGSKSNCQQDSHKM